MFNTELTTYKTGGGTPSDKSMHPGEYGRVSAWIKKTKNDLVLLNKDIYGHPPHYVPLAVDPTGAGPRRINYISLAGYGQTLWQFA